MDSGRKEQRISQIQNTLEARETENLLQIWEQNNRQEWSDEAFEAIRRILTYRLGAVPPQPAHPAEVPPPVVLDDESHLDEAEAHLDQADAYVEAEEIELALAECEAAVQAAPHWAEPRYYRGRMLADLGRLEEAISDFEISIRLDPKYYPARDGLSQTKLELEENSPWPPPVEGSTMEGPDAQVAENEDLPSIGEPAEFDSGVTEEEAQMPPLYLDEKAMHLRGWPGYRQRPNRSGYDPLEMDFELAHMEGVFLRDLIHLRLRTNNPFYLAGMAAVGVFSLTPCLFALYNPCAFGLALPMVGIGLLLLANLMKNLRFLGETGWDEAA